ncbi:MAG TPA: mannose-1-phosphate guanylyltransferase/mannose-6-phosphate isomerase [Caldimonas sp.]|nr:mannose-1-phosphate guanylyltransferase/mannose-6-phosphate isomerase [Caldimonas sp.]HEX2542294.1 mannose-1-phosphate guanylyltransferase/mannose-6-phosphate isomerase [Caldimonas sp.]
MSESTLSVVPVILAGGSGTRLWPLSRSLHPKQYLSLGIGNGAAGETLFQQAARRAAAIAAADIAVQPPCIVANEEHRFTVVDQLRGIGIEPARVLLEPFGRNTAPALHLAALEATRSSGGSADPVLVVTPADHLITQLPAFTQTLRTAVRAAASGGIVVLGIRPERPDTGYGYIRAGDSADADGLLPVAAFVEKPDLATARKYVADDGYLWNGGIFVVRASVWLEALRRFRPELARASEAAYATATADDAFLRFDRDAFAAIPGDSVDYAVMEPASRQGSGISVRMVPLDAGWSDLGAWDAVWQAGERDSDGNAVQGDAVLRNSRNTLVHATSRLVGVIGMDDVTVVETADAVLVAHRSKSGEVKDLVGTLAETRRSETSTHRRVHRPWGWYECVDQGPRFQVKRIMVKPGARLSLQMHHHRAEHWIVVSGTAEVTNGESVSMLTENQSTYIPLGQTHRLANPGKLPLEIIEVQSGSYLGEDDIVRFEDNYGRR